MFLLQCFQYQSTCSTRTVEFITHQQFRVPQHPFDEVFFHGIMCYQPDASPYFWFHFVILLNPTIERIFCTLPHKTATRYYILYVQGLDSKKFFLSFLYWKKKMKDKSVYILSGHASPHGRCLTAPSAEM